jgi:hypothetical protein
MSRYLAIVGDEAVIHAPEAIIIVLLWFDGLRQIGAQGVRYVPYDER